MSIIRDFQDPVRPRATTATSRASAPPPPSSPITRDNPSLDRRGSIRSRDSSHSNDGGLRFRRPSRSNTITAYNQPDEDRAVWEPGAEPGIDPSADEDLLPTAVTQLQAPCIINIIDFSQASMGLPIVADNDSLAQILEEERPDDMPCRWISVNGLSWDVIRVLGKKYNLHKLAIEDLTITRTRTKVDWYADHAFIVLTLQKLVKLHKHWKSDSPEQDDSGQHGEDSRGSSGWKFWKQKKSSRQMSDLPYYLDKDRDGKVDEFVNAHSNTSEETPMKPTRTIHRYESQQIPEHTAFMERHSALAAEDLAVSVEQVSIFLLEDNTVISIFEQSAEDVVDPIIRRLNLPETMVRQSCDASMVVQSIIDGIVDLGVPIRDAYNKARKELQIDAMTNPNIKTSRALHIFGEEIDMLQNLFKPLVALVNALRDHNSDPNRQPSPPPLPPMSATPPPPEEFNSSFPSEKPLGITKRDREGAPKYNRQLSSYRRTVHQRPANATSVTISPLAHTYFGDVLDHCITMIQALEQMDASAGNISTLIFNTVGAKTNNFMMILALVTVFFAPLTFVSGYFGMNFAKGKGLVHPFGFFWIVAIPALIGFMILVSVTMLWENITDFLKKRGIKAHRLQRSRKLRRPKF